MELIDQHVESLIFTSGQPISEKEITTSIQRALDENITKVDIDASIERLTEKYKSEEYAFEIVPISKGYHFMTKGAFHTTVGEHLKVISKKKLSRAALETLSIVAYKQPVTRMDLEAIRGVSCDYTIQKLMEKELVEMQGRADGPGRPLLYGTSEKFMDYFGIKDLKDLPKPKDFEMPETEVGEPAPIEVVIPTEGNESGDADTITTEETTENNMIQDVESPESNLDMDQDVSVVPEDEIESEETESMLEVKEVRSEEFETNEPKTEELKPEVTQIMSNGSSKLDENIDHQEIVKSEEEDLHKEIVQSEEIIEIQNSSSEEE